ncbi:Na+/H+ antiporter subunit E [Halovenus sp. HT40]|uniref:Na+/H+ antiporter subunit E n=1 Tax=Halovenus sp. HT40 TaxID=3126691 RepID=UPI00300F693E
MKTRRWLVAGLLFAVLWVFVSGPKVTIRSVVTVFIVGLAVGLPVAYVFRRLYGEEIDLSQTISAIPYVILYILVFFKEVLVANVDVAYRVLVPGRALEPQVILVPLRVETALGVTTIANSITITPGTVTLDHDPDENALYVHMIDGRSPDEVVEPIRQWEDYALQIFDERHSPGDPAPEITVHPPDHPPEPKSITEEQRTERLDDGGESDG